LAAEDRRKLRNLLFCQPENDMLTRYTAVLSVGAPQGRQDASAAGNATLDAIRGLTPRQQEVLNVMMQGKSNKGICRILNLAEPTVKNHVTAILRALAVTNRTEAVLKATRASALSTPYPSSYSNYLGYVPMAAPLTFR
jgi:DNA-binding CsgD family transcriptional regulator